jgi:hypothetical protein
MANVVKKHSISSELNGGSSGGESHRTWRYRERGNSRRRRQSQGLWPDGWCPDPLHRDCAEQGVHALFGVPTQDLFNFIQSDPSLLAGMPTLARVAAWGGGFLAIGVSGAPTVQNDVDCARAALAVVPDAVPTE